MIVIDVGCARYGGDYSIERLVEEFHPDVLYGLDPNPAVHTGMPKKEYLSAVAATTVTVERAAAWTYDGEIGYVEAGLGSWVTLNPLKPRVPCVDLARLVLSQPE